MGSIKTRLAALITLVICSVMIAIGYLSYHTASQTEERDYLAAKQGLTERLALSLPHGVWQLDEQFIRLTLDAELKSPTIVGLIVQGDAGLYFGRMRLSDGKIGDLDKAAPPPHDEVMTLPIIYQQRNNLGQVTAYLSRERIVNRLNNQLWVQSAQLLIVVVLLLVVLMLALRRYVFTPIVALQSALHKAATLEVEADIQIPQASWREFSDLVTGVNLIIVKISNELGLRKSAQTIAIAEKERAEAAYQQLLETQRTLVESEKLASLGGLVAGVAHEINTPVGITLTTASHLAMVTDKVREQMDSGQIKKSELENYLRDASESSRLILGNSQRAADLIHSFKQVAVDQTSEARRKFNIDQYLGEIITSLSPKLRHSRIAVDIDCPAELEMDSYPGALSQVVTNLVMNALLHAYNENARGLIMIQVDPLAGRQIRLTIRDDGNGIPADNIKHIFEPFFTTKRGNGGSGLGLHIVHNIVFKKLGGSIQVDSTVGEGTSFTLTMPCMAPEMKN